MISPEPSWSPDGTQITFLSNRDIGFSFDVYAMDAPATLPFGLLADLVKKYQARRRERGDTTDHEREHRWSRLGHQPRRWRNLVHPHGVEDRDRDRVGTAPRPLHQLRHRLQPGLHIGDHRDPASRCHARLGVRRMVWGLYRPGPTCTLSVDASKTSTARFNSSGGGIHTLSVTRVGSGAVRRALAGIQCGSDCTEAYAAGALVKLTAISAKG